jgi:glycosyltransferase involved in cell wall biosynthesis/tetratricopeptide (TPR) repeat protein
VSRRYLFGPVTAAFADQKLHPQRRAGACLTFNPNGDADLRIAATDNWQTIAGRFPAGWQPDFVVLNLGYTCVPACLWSAPVPLVGLAPDWNLLWHAYRHRLRQCRLVLTDTLGVEILRREGIPHALGANLFGCDRSYVEEAWPEVPRDLDLLFVGNFNPAVQRQRLPWLARLARLARRRKVLLTTGVFGADYRLLLARARIVFNHGIRGECNQRAFEAAAAGALLFQEEDNRETPAFFHDRRECVYYNADNLETLLDYYLEHEDERRAIAEAARAAVGGYTYAKLWEQHLERIEPEWPALQERAGKRFVPDTVEALRARTWEVLGSCLGDDPTLAHDLRATQVREPRAVLYNALGLLAGRGFASCPLTPNPSPPKRGRGEKDRPPLPGTPGRGVGGEGSSSSRAGPSPQKRGRKKKAARQQGTLPPRSSLPAPRQTKEDKAAALALAHFRTALARDPADVHAGLNAAEALGQLDRIPQAVAQAQGALQKLEESSTLAPDGLDVCHFSPLFDLFRVEWERAAWANAGQAEAEIAAKRDLLRWRLHTLLAEWTGDLGHFYKAHQARPDLWPSLAALGCALGRAGRVAEAAGYLREAVAANPFDTAAARALYQSLGDIGDHAARVELVRQRRDLAAAVPLLAREPWFDAVATGGPPVVVAAPRPTGEPPVATEDRQAGHLSVRGEDRPLRIVWEGAQQAVHSFGIVNRALCSHLLARGHEVCVLASASPGLAELAPDGSAPPDGYRIVEGDAVPLPHPLAASFYRPLAGPAEVHVRHQWPPQFTPPPEGHWVLVQPWEYGSIPRAWLEPLTQVDEVWAYTEYVRDCYLAAGVPAERVHVVPCGVDCERFSPQAPPLALPTRKRCKFLFVGGTLHRKGIDLLLEAYARTFSAADDVCLVIKDMGGRSFYRGQTAQEQIEQHQRRDGAAEIVYLDRTLSETELAGLYTACDCLVHPYRGEGFGLPIAEAMACGLPVIVTAAGAARDFCDQDNAYLIPAQRRFFTDKRVGELETVDFPWLAEPDAAALAAHLRNVFEHPEEARAKGRQGCERIRERFTWDRAAEAAEQRLRELRGRPIRRLQPKGATIVAGRRQKVSLCMIVKNEEANLLACLQSVAGLVDEIIVIDTGSTDRTKEIAAACGARVFTFPWVDSFAAARNESLRNASGDWIFWLDADDRLDADNRRKLRELFAELKDENAAFVMKCLCLPDPQTGTATRVDHVRLFRNDPAVRWEYRVHEQVLPSLRRCGAAVRWVDVVIQHTGYQDPALRRRKLERDRRLLEMESAEKPDDPFILFNRGCIAQELGRLDEAIPLLRRSLERSHAKDSIVRKLYALLAQCHRQLGQGDLALAACRKGLEFYPKDVELLFQEGLVLRERGERAAAKACWSLLLRPQSAEHFASIDTGLCGYKARHNLALVCLEDGNLTEAEAHWRAALAEQPGFALARLGLGEVSRRRGH